MPMMQNDPGIGCQHEVVRKTIHSPPKEDTLVWSKSDVQCGPGHVTDCKIIDKMLK